MNLDDAKDRTKIVRNPGCPRRTHDDAALPFQEFAPLDDLGLKVEWKSFGLFEIKRANATGFYEAVVPGQQAANEIRLQAGTIDGGKGEFAGDAVIMNRPGESFFTGARPADDPNGCMAVRGEFRLSMKPPLFRAFASEEREREALDRALSESDERFRKAFAVGGGSELSNRLDDPKDGESLVAFAKWKKRNLPPGRAELGGGNRPANTNHAARKNFRWWRQGLQERSTSCGKVFLNLARMAVFVKYEVGLRVREFFECPIDVANPASWIEKKDGPARLLEERGPGTAGGGVQSRRRCER